MEKWMVSIASVIVLIVNIVTTIVLLTTVTIDSTIIVLILADIAVTAHFIYTIVDYLIND